MREYVFGSGQLYATDTSGNNPMKFGVLQDVTISFSGDLKQLHGQYGLPVAVGRGKQKVEIKAGNGDIDVNLYNAIYFGGTSGGGQVTTGSYAQAVDEQMTPQAAVSSITSTSITQAAGIATATFATAHGMLVGEDLTVTGAAPAGYNVAGVPILSVPSPTTLTYAVPPATTSPAGTQGSFSTTAAAAFPANAAGFYRDLGVSYKATGVRLKQITSGSPLVGQYTVNQTTGLYTFNATDEGSVMLVNYVYKVATGNLLTITNQLIGTEPTFELLLAEEFQSNWTIMQLNAVKCGKLSQPLKLDDFSLSDIEMEAFVDGTNTLGWMSTTVGEPD